MKTIIFELAGKPKDYEDVFLMSKHRKYKNNTTIFHNNDFHTVLSLPEDFFKLHFKYVAKHKVYTNNLRWSDLYEKGFISVYKLDHVKGFQLL